MTKIMGIVNLTPDSFYGPSRVTGVEEAMGRILAMAAEGADLIDLGAVSTRPGAEDVGEDEEWRRLVPVLESIASCGMALPGISIDTTRSVIVRRAFSVIGGFMVNDISSGEDDPEMLGTVGELGLPFIAMHKCGTPRTMDSLTDIYEERGGMMNALLEHFAAFGERASAAGIADWIADPGLGFAKTPAQCLYILDHLEELKVFGRPLLIGAADKRFTAELPGGTEEAHETAIRHGADILRVHSVSAARKTLEKTIPETRTEA